MTIGFETEKAAKFTARWTGSIEGYAIMWLNISNNIRESKELYKLTNNKDNDIYLICEEGSKTSTKDYLQRLNLEVINEETVTVVMPYVNYDNDEEYDWEIIKPSEY